MKRGRKRLAAEILQLRGSRHAPTDAGSSPVNAGECRRPACPRWLSPEARPVFRSIATVLEETGKLIEADQSLIAAAAEGVAEWRQAVEKLAEEEAVITFPNGAVGPNPWTKIRDSSFRRFRTALADLGIRPADRKAAIAPTRPSEDDLEEWRKRNAQ